MSGGVLRTLRIILFLFLAPMVVGAGIGGLKAFARGVPSIADLKQNITPPSTKVYADDDALIGEFKLIKGRHMPLRKMPISLLNAVVAVEDAHFWSHSGIDYKAVMRAALTDILKGHLKEGGSTITQQLAKMTFLTPEKTFKRKFKEFVLATRIERNLTKEEILELYLNRAYFGHGAYGVEMASRIYFGKPVMEITLPESAIIAGLLKAPAAYSPANNFEKAKARQRTVLRRMKEERFITGEQFEEAQEASILLAGGGDEESSYNYFLEYVRRRLVEKYGAETVYKGGMRVYSTLNRRAQLSAQRAMQEGLRKIDKRRGFRGPIRHIEETGGEEAGRIRFTAQPPSVGDILEGVVLAMDKDTAMVRTDAVTGTLPVENVEWARFHLDPESMEHKEMEDFTIQKILAPGDVIRVRVQSLTEEGAVFALDQEPEVQGALVALEPHSGYVRALVGGYDFNKSEYNRALSAERQAGSAFKPIIYALALQSGFTTASVIMDEEVTFDKPDEEPDEGEGAFANTPEGAAIAKAKAEKEKSEAEAAKEDKPGEGEGEEEEEIKAWTPRNYDNEYHGPTRLRDALAYSRNVVTVKLVDAIGISRVIRFAHRIGIRSRMPRDLTLSLGSMSVTPIELTSAYSSFANGGVKMEPICIKYITDRHGRVIENNDPRGDRVMDPQTAFLTTSMLKDVVNYGTGWRARALGVPTAGKTGTTNDYRDAWFMGYTTDMVTGVWTGFDDPRPLGLEETGSRAAAPIWVNFMKSVTNRNDPKDFHPPEGIITRIIDPATGLLANMWTKNATTEYFREGTEPRDVTPSIWQAEEQTDSMF